MPRKSKKPPLYHFIMSRSPACPQFTELVGSYDCQSILDVMQRLFMVARDRGEHIEYRCTAAYDDPTEIAATVAKSNEVCEPIKIRESAGS
jgi:hypothetical protein